MVTFQGVPSRRDPRWGQVAALTAFCILGQTVLNFEITPLEILLSVFTCVSTDMVLTRIRRHQVIVPLSSLISGLGLSLLLRSTYPAVFVVAGLLAIGSKHLIIVHGRHRFNPTNFGLVVTLAFTQGGIAMVTPGQWGRSGLIIFAILGVGALVVFRAERLALVGMFVVFQVTLTMVFHGGHPNLATSLSGAVLAFAFFMITDPKTAPTSWRRQGCYAGAIALLGQVFAAWGSMDGLFVAAFAVGLAMLALEGHRPLSLLRPLTPRAVAAGT